MVILGGFFSSTLFHVIGALYPAYQTFKALNNTNKDNTNDDNYDETIEENEKQQGYSNNEKTENNNNSSVTNAKNWLTYWCVYATLITLEYFLLFFNWLPFYYEFKILFLFWLIFNVNNEFGGSNFIYKQYILPFLESRELQIDLILEEISEIFIPIKNFIKELPKEEVYKLKIKKHNQALMNKDEMKEEEEAMAEEEEVIVINKANKENDINKEEENVVEIEEGHEENDERLVVEVKINNNESENKDSNNKKKKKKNAFKRFGERVVKILKKKKQHERSLSLLDIIHQ